MLLPNPLWYLALLFSFLLVCFFFFLKIKIYYNITQEGCKKFTKTSLINDISGLLNKQNVSKSPLMLVLLLSFLLVCFFFFLKNKNLLHHNTRRMQKIYKNDYLWASLPTHLSSTDKRSQYSINTFKIQKIIL